MTTVLVAGLLSGCGCTIFSTDAGCQVSNGALMTAAAPLIAVTALSDSISDSRETSQMRTAVLAGDMHAQALCMLRCNTLSLDRAERTHLLAVSADNLLVQWSTAPPAPALPILMAIHWEKTQWLRTDDAQQTLAQWRLVAQLAADPRMKTAVTSATWGANAVNTGFYDDLATNAQSMLIKAAEGVGKPCRAVGPWPPAWMDANEAKHNLLLACDIAKLPFE